MAAIKDELIRARVSSQLKKDAEEVLDNLGLSMPEAIRLFLTQISLRHEFPIELKVPNKITEKAIAEEPTDDVYNNMNEIFDEVVSDT